MHQIRQRNRKWLASSSKRGARRERTERFRPHLEALEDRTLLDVALAPDAVNRNITAGFADNQLDTTIVVNPNNPNQMFAAASGVWRWSNTGGTTWNNSNSDPGVSCCPKASWDRFGNLFVVYWIGLLQVVRSSNGGQDFTLVGSVSGTGFGFSIDTGPSAPGTGFTDSVWVSYVSPDLGRVLVRGAGISGLGTPSLLTWTGDIVIGSGGGIANNIAVGQGGRVLVTYQTVSEPSQIRVHTDVDGLGVGRFDAGVSVTATNVVPDPRTRVPAQPGLGINAQPKLACDHFGGYCYLVYVERLTPTSNDTDIYMRKSLSGGPWSARVQVNDDATANSQFNPSIDVDNAAGSTGDVAIAWLDARNAGAANNRVEVWGTVQYYGNNWFWPNSKLSRGIFSCVLAGGNNCWEGDTGMYHNGAFYRAWPDNTVPSLLTPANANNPPNSQDMAFNRVVVDNRDIGATPATAHNTGMGPGPCSYFHVTEPLGNDSNGDGGGRGRRDVDLYRFTANAGHWLTLRTHLPTGGFQTDTYLRVFNSAGVQLAGGFNDDDEPTADHYSRLTIQIPASGTYYVGVSGYNNIAYNPNVYGSGVDGSIGDYTLDMSLTASADAGDTALSARILPVGPGVSSYLEPCEVIGNGTWNRRDVDLYRIQATAGQVLTAITSLPGGGDSADTYLRIFNSSYTQVAADDNGGPGLYSLVNYVVPTTGVYYIGVSAWPNTTYNLVFAGSGVSADERTRLGDYSLYVGLAAGPDIGDTLATALVTGMGPGQSRYQRNWEVLGNGPYGVRDVDMYRFEVQAGMYFNAATSLPPGAGAIADTIIRLFNAAGTQLASNDDCAGGTRYSCLNSFRIPATGTYYLGVSGYPNFSYNPTVAGSGAEGRIGDYRLNMSLRKRPVPTPRGVLTPIPQPALLSRLGGGGNAPGADGKHGSRPPAEGPVEDRPSLFDYQAGSAPLSRWSTFGDQGRGRTVTPPHVPVVDGVFDQSEGSWLRPLLDVWSA